MRSAYLRTSYVSDAHHIQQYAERIATETEETAYYPREKDRMTRNDVQIEVEKKKEEKRK